MSKKKQGEEPITSDGVLDSGVAAEAPKAVDKKISLEMTEAEAQEFADFKLKKEAEVAAQAPEELVDVHLRFAHGRNGVTYGPGLVRNVPRGMAAAMIQADEEALRARMRVHESNDTLMEIISSGQARIVKSGKVG